jgi:hypothetical protein
MCVYVSMFVCMYGAIATISYSICWNEHYLRWLALYNTPNHHVGGAEVLGMGSVVGNFLPGKKLDCLVVDPRVPGGPFDVFPGEDFSAMFQKFLFLGDDRNIITIFVDGKKVL